MSAYLASLSTHNPKGRFPPISAGAGLGPTVRFGMAEISVSRTATGAKQPVRRPRTLG